ncbi:MAG TPA: hypothetical protein VJB57_18415 [Dehalococcoidia bacterium]|nr:hypothetical protein [Dehalococcoidia bacterium]
MNKRAKTVRFSLAGAGLALLLGLWGAIHNHDAYGTPDTTATEPAAASDLASGAQPSSTAAGQAAPQSQPAAQPLSRVHTRTRAS